MARAPVRLNVYDMYWLNDYASNIGFGIFHSGIEIYGIEYAYGGHPYQFSGVFENSPQDAEELGENFKFRESIHLGETDFTASEVREVIKSLGGEFRGDRYHLISRNCNHFSAVFAKTLTGREIPGWINRLANISGSIPFLDRMLPQEWLTPVALQQSLERKKSIDVAEEAIESVGVGQSLNGPSSAHRNNSRTTVLEGKTSSGDMGSGSVDTLYATSNGSAVGTGKSVQSAQSNAGSASPSLQRIWTQLKSSIGGVETTLKF